MSDMTRAAKEQRAAEAYTSAIARVRSAERVDRNFVTTAIWHILTLLKSGAEVTRKERRKLNIAWQYRAHRSLKAHRPSLGFIAVSAANMIPVTPASSADYTSAGWLAVDIDFDGDVRADVDRDRRLGSYLVVNDSESIDSTEIIEPDVRRHDRPHYVAIDEPAPGLANEPRPDDPHRNHSNRQHIVSVSAYDSDRSNMDSIELSADWAIGKTALRGSAGRWRLTAEVLAHPSHSCPAGGPFGPRALAVRPRSSAYPRGSLLPSVRRCAVNKTGVHRCSVQLHNSTVLVAAKLH